jgi:hypothetical protein
MKLNGTDVVQVAEKREKASTEFVVPDLDLVVIAAGHKERLKVVKAHSAHRPVVFVEAVEHGAHAIIPKLNDAIV